MSDLETFTVSVQVQYAPDRDQARTLLLEALIGLPLDEGKAWVPDAEVLGGDFEKFVRSVAALPRDGEIVDGRQWEMENDDAFETVNELIGYARELLGEES